MKTNKILLLAFGGVMVALVITGLLLLRNDVAALSEGSEEYQYSEAEVMPAERIHIKGMWNIRFQQGRKFKLEVAGETQADDTQWATNDGVLELRHGIKDTCRARLTLPVLKEVIAEESTRLTLNRFEGDTVNVTLGEGVTLIDNNNRFMCMQLDTKGNTTVKMLNTDL